MLDRLLQYVYRLVRYRAYWVIGVFLVLVVLVLSYVFPFPVSSSLLDLLPQGDPLIEEYRNRKEVVNNTEYLTAVLSLEGGEELNTRKRKEKLLELAAVMKPALADIQEIESVSYRGGASIPEEYRFLYSLNEKTVEQFNELEADWEQFQGLDPGAGGLDEGGPYSDLVQEFNRLESDSSPSGERLSSFLDQLEERNRIVLSALDSTDELEDWDRRLEALRERLRSAREERESELEGEYFSPDGSTLLVRARPRQPGSHDIQFSRKLTRAARAAVEEVKKSSVFQSGAYRIELTGSFITNAERNSALKVDMLWTTVISSLAVMVAFFFALGSLFYSILIAFPLVVAVLLALSWAKFSVGGFNLLTTFLPALVLGLSIDYGIHLLFRFSEERSRGLSVSKAIEITILKKGKGIFIAALTTATVFTTLILSRSRGLVEMGIITSLGIMVSFFVYLFLLPSMIVAYQRWRRRRRTVELFDYRGTLRGLVSKAIDYGKPLLVLALILSCLALVGASRLDFQFSSNNVSTEVKSVKVQGRIREEFGSSDISMGPTFVFFPDGMEGLKKLEKELPEIDLVKSVKSVRDYLPKDLDQLEGKSVGDPTELERLDRSLARVEEFLGDKSARVERIESLVGRISSAQLSSTLSSRTNITLRLNELIDQLLEIRRRLLEVNQQKVLGTISSLRDNLQYLAGGARTLERLFERGEEGVLEALPPEIGGTFTTERGEYVVFADVDKSVYDSDKLNQFVSQASELSDDYFGFPLIQYQLEGHIRHDFIVSTTLAVLMIAFLLHKGISNLRLSLLAIIPVVLGYLWMLGGMKLGGMNFNFINIIISPLLIGIGVDDGLHLIYRWQEESGEGRIKDSILSAFSRTGLAVITTSITTIVVFGSLFLARTPGLRILGATASLGIGFAMVLSLTVLPAALYLAFSRDEK